MKRISSLLFSMATTGLLLIVFAVAIGYATFIENDFGTITAKIRVYNSKWFEALLLLIVLNLIGSIVINKLMTRKKWSMFLFHVSFIVIFIGASVTRYTGTEGNMHIREGSSSDEILSEESYVSINISDGQNFKSLIKEVKFSGSTKNRFREKILINDKLVIVENIRFIPSATKRIVEDTNGIPLISLMAIGQQKQRLEFILKKGEERNINNFVFSFEKPTDATTVLIKESDGGLVITALKNVFSAGNMGSELTKLPLGEEFPLNGNLIYKIGHIKFVLKQYVPKGLTQLVYNPENEGSEVIDAFQAKITVGDKSEILDVFGSKGLSGQPVSTTIDNIDITVTYGPILKKIPFALYLKDFQIERYPGSNSPSSFASEVTLIDKNDNVERPSRIFMNNILKYKGYRFFQSSYDTDEKGTILSVNYDSWGTTITYIGYFIMSLGMVFSLFNKNSRFNRLIRALTKLKVQKSAMLVVLLFGVSFLLNAREEESGGSIDKSHAKSFGQLLVQSKEGRIEPVSSLASKILRKVYKKTRFEGMSAVEIFLDMNSDPGKWADKPIIKISGKQIKMILGVSGNYISLQQVMMGGYKIEKHVEEAYGKKSGLRIRTDKEIIKIDERVNICYLALSGEFLKIFPIPDNPNHTWIFLKGSENQLPEENKEFAIRVLSNYLAAVNNAKINGNWDEANSLLNELKENQVKFGSSVIPGNTKIKLEIFYINYNIFNKLAKGYLFIGLILLISVFINIFKPGIKLRKIIGVGIILVFILFMLHSIGLAIRWYISGHAPWSNGYESMIFISWATCLSGLVFAKKSQIALAVTTILSAITLLIAGLSWMSPEITNLAPVLKSYWLIIHVAVVTASYGFFAIGSLLGLTNLILIILRNEKNNTLVTDTIRELIYIIEIALIIGLFLLTIGSFLGGAWANESWGRYWGWDPKETWAMVTILVYSFIVHMHKIPMLKGHFQVSTAAFVGFGSVLMTYFGVNYYLSGLHSYASGDPIPIPRGVYIAVFVILIIILAAFVSKRSFSKNVETDELLEDAK
ncbi:MAG: cytochrome c biogenesis protein CcsA [Bacteroidales bacterium]|nr:cytochrome c biogenesis protein CcsA [Bacteroidales bacterium]